MEKREEREEDFKYGYLEENEVGAREVDAFRG